MGMYKNHSTFKNISQSHLLFHINLLQNIRDQYHLLE
jgi:hypothetical protein